MEGFTELLTDAFSVETLGPPLSSEDLDFENLNLDENCEPGEAAGVRRRDGALLQEAAGESAASPGQEAEDVPLATEKVYKMQDDDDESGEEELQGGGVRLTCLDRAPKEDYTSSEGESDEEGSPSGDEEEEEDVEGPGELLASVCCSGEVCEKEDRIFAEGQPLAPQGVGNPQVSNEEQGEAGSDEEPSYFGRAPERAVVRSEASAEDDSDKQDASSDPDGERGPGGPHHPSASLDFHCLSLQNLQDLITEVDGEECVEKMEEFSGEEHQEAGESFAEYPSDFSSCEYAEDGAGDRDSDGEAGVSVGPWHCSSERDVPDVTWSGTAETPEDDGEADAAGWEGPDVAGSAGSKEESVVEVAEVEDSGESDSYSSSDDDVNVRRSHNEASSYWGWQDPESEALPEDGRRDGGGRAMFRVSGERLTSNSGADAADFLGLDFREVKPDRLLSEFFSTTEDTHLTGTHTSGVKRRHADDDGGSPMVEGDDLKSPSSQGSLDDRFFFDAGGGTPGVAGGGVDEYEEERNWEHEQERIRAFYDYYDDSDEDDEREGRQTKVQFCADPLSQIIHYETDSSDGESLSSSTDRDDDRSSADTSDELVEPGDTQRLNPECEPPTVQLQGGVPDVRDAHIHARQRRCLSSVKLLLKMGLVTAAGLLMFWLATDDADWLHQVSIY